MAVGSTLTVVGIILLFSFPGMPGAIGASFALISVGLLTANSMRLVASIGDELRRRCNPPRTGP